MFEVICTIPIESSIDGRALISSEVEEVLKAIEYIASNTVDDNVVGSDMQ